MQIDIQNIHKYYVKSEIVTVFLVYFDDNITR